MKPARQPDSLLAAIAPLAQQIAAIRKQMRAQGLFAHDRELLECRRCGLKEDVTHDGRLITGRESDLGRDTGLRFTRAAKNGLRCPACGRRVGGPRREDGPHEGLLP